MSAKAEFRQLQEDSCSDDDDDDSFDNQEDDVNEMRAFMHMFMDLVGIFNEGAKGKHSGGRSGNHRSRTGRL